MIARIFITIVVIVLVAALLGVFDYYGSSVPNMLFFLLVIALIVSMLWGSTRHKITEDDLNKMKKNEIKRAKMAKIFKDISEL